MNIQVAFKLIEEKARFYQDRTPEGDPMYVGLEEMADIATRAIAFLRKEEPTKEGS